MRDLDLTSLRLFVAVCETRNIARAAEQQAIVGSAISKRLAALEDTVGTPLLVRRRHGVAPTPAGETLLEHARALLARAAQIERDMAGYAAGVRGHVRVLATQSAIAESLADDVAAFLKMPAHRDIRIDMEEAVSTQVLRGVREGGASLGICWDAADLRGLHHWPWRGDHLAVVMPPSHPLARNRRLDFADTLPFEHVSMPPESAVVPGAFGEAGLKLTPRHYAYLKISEGCNHRCTFCIIPSMRGDLVSRPIGDVLKEARALFEGGVKELLVISQDTSAYGVDLKYRTGFWDGRPVKTRLLELVQALGELAAPHGAWVRLHYVYPYPSVDEIIPLMAQGKVLPYLDVPFQHSHPDVLRRMKRPASGEKNLERIARWREMCPELVIRSTFIAGFPGETEAEFDHLLDFMREAGIDRAGCFAYSPVEGATANDLPGMLPAELREERRARFMQVAEEVSTAKLQRRVGATMQVLVDSAPAMGRRGGVGRSYADAPEIDGTVQLLPPEKISKRLTVGEFTRARVVGTQGHDLIALPV